MLVWLGMACRQGGEGPGGEKEEKGCKRAYLWFICEDQQMQMAGLRYVRLSLNTSSYFSWLVCSKRKEKG